MADPERRFFDSSAPLALVTGASSGMGEHIARRLSQRGYRLVLISRDADQLHRHAAEWSAHAPCLARPMDLCDTESIGATIEPLLRRASQVSLLVNAAGTGVFKPMLQQSAAQHLRLFQINYLATYQMIRCVLPMMLQQGHGHVINIASMSSKMGPWGHAGYAGAKSAVVSLTQTLAAEHHDGGVHFSYINPGIVNTPFFRKPNTQGLWNLVSHRAISPELIAQGVEQLIDRPQLELCVPRHYRLLDLVRAISVRWAHRLVRRGSTPAEPPTAADVEIRIARQRAESATK